MLFRRPNLQGNRPIIFAFLLIAIPILLSQPGCTGSTKTADSTEATVDSKADAQPAADAPDAMAAFLAIQDEYDAKMKEVREAVRNAKTDEERQAAWAESPNEEEYTKRYLDIVKAHPNTEASSKSLLRIVRSREISDETIEILKREMVDSEDTVQVLSRLTRNPNDELESVFDNVIENSTVETNRAFATYLKAKRLMYRRKLETREDEIKDLIHSLSTEYPDISNNRGGTLKDSGDALLFEIDRLQVGMEVPEIEGEDIDGEEFKLSDYRGKVVFLDFWGDW